MTKVSISYMKANGATTKLEIENGSAEEVAKAFKQLKIDPATLTRNGGKFDGELEDDAAVVRSDDRAVAQRALRHLRVRRLRR